jgi:RimJ/RimL family protein N-acetyltransferase
MAPGDLPSFQSYRADPETGRYQGWTPMSDVEAAAFLAAMTGAPLFAPGVWCQLALADPRMDALLGDIGLCLSEDEREVEIGFTLDPAHQGRGLAGEAVGEAIRLVFAQTSADRVKGVTDARNLRSIRTLERVGMGRVETVQTTFRGEPCTEFVYAIRRAQEA